MSYEKGKLINGTGVCIVNGFEERVPLSAMDYPHVGITKVNCDKFTCQHFDCLHNSQAQANTTADYLISKDI